MKFVLFLDRQGHYRWRLVSRNGRVMADSGGGYGSRAGALRAARSVRSRVTNALVVDEHPSQPARATSLAFLIYQDHQGQYRWRLVSRNGRLVADSGEGFATQASVRRSIARIRAEAGQARIEPTPVDRGLPPDPSTIAPPLDPTVVTEFASATSFLYTGPRPIQGGVELGTIEPARAAVLRGRVGGRDGKPLSGVTVRVMGNPSYGSTVSRADGMFDLAVNGGGQLTLDYSADGYLPAQRHIEVPCRDYVWAPSVVLVQYDGAATELRLNAGDAQVARGGRITDGDGVRQATVLVPPGTQARMLFPDGWWRLTVTGRLHEALTEMVAARRCLRAAFLGTQDVTELSRGLLTA
jgi:uncharacterized protein YegP (UPF0339 family)